MNQNILLCGYDDGGSSPNWDKITLLTEEMNDGVFFTADDNVVDVPVDKRVRV